jgi:hypothetical protein
MIKTAIENLAEPIGFDIAHSDDIVQSNLLNGLGRGFATYNESNLDMQLCYIEQKLTPQTRKFLKGLVEFIKLRENA